MEVLPVSAPEFHLYGSIPRCCTPEQLKELDTLLLAVPVPSEGTAYERSWAPFEASSAFSVLERTICGTLKAEFGYCCGQNSRLAGMEYHNGSELIYSIDDIVLLLGLRGELTEDGCWDTANVKAFLLPAGTPAELYASTLHLTPCTRHPGEIFRAAILLPFGTNAPLVHPEPCTPGNLLFRQNKWLTVRKNTPQASWGAFTGITGPEIFVT